jgi:polyisoprenyl-phosphate glycosyltransferase
MSAERDFLPVISLVVPMYNEGEGIDAFFVQTEKVLDDLQTQGQILKYEIICVNDGSADDTVARLAEHHKRNANIKVVDLSRNFGKEAALTAGMAHICGDIIVPIDADLEEPPSLIAEFLTYWRDGYDIIYGARVSREFDSFAKQFTAKVFYRVFNAISEHPIPSDAGDFRLMDRAVVDIINAMPERNRFMKGIFSWPGFRTKAVSFQRQPRQAGTTKFSPFKLLGLAFSGIISFSLAPIRLFIYLGALISCLAFFYLVYIVGKTVLFGIDEPGYASLMSVLLFLGGIQVLGLGIIGEYVGRIYVEVKSRPIYIIQKRIGFDTHPERTKL